MTATLPKVFVIGSSTTLRMHPHLEQMLQGCCSYSRKGSDPCSLLEAHRDLDVPQGASGGDSGMVLSYLRLLDHDENFHPDLVLLHVGFHDIRTDPDSLSRQVPLERFRQNVEDIVQWFAAKDIQLVWMRPGPLDEKLHNARCQAFHRYEADLQAYNEAADLIMEQQAVPSLDLAGFTMRLGPMAQILKDHVHFNDDVVRQQAAFVAGYIGSHFGLSR